MRNRMLKIGKKKDILFIAAVLAVAFVFFLYNQQKASYGGRWIIVTVDGKEYGTYSLEVDNEINIKTERGYNKLMIQGGMAYMAEADCPDQYCVDKGKINKNGESLICLPHRVVAEVRIEKGKNKNEEDQTSFDAVL